MHGTFNFATFGVMGSLSLLCAACLAAAPRPWQFLGIKCAPRCTGHVRVSTISPDERSCQATQPSVVSSI